MELPSLLAAIPNGPSILCPMDDAVVPSLLPCSKMNLGQGPLPKPCCCWTSPASPLRDLVGTNWWWRNGAAVSGKLCRINITWMGVNMAKVQTVIMHDHDCDHDYDHGCNQGSWHESFRIALVKLTTHPCKYDITEVGLAKLPSPFSPLQPELYQESNM